MRATRKEIHGVERIINNLLEEHGYEKRIMVGWAYGQPRAYWTYPDSTAESDLSPRLPMGEMLRWLYAFEEGLRIGICVSEQTHTMRT